jgi:hypothetical protein
VAARSCLWTRDPSTIDASRVQEIPAFRGQLGSREHLGCGDWCQRFPLPFAAPASRGSGAELPRVSRRGGLQLQLPVSAIDSGILVAIVLSTCHGSGKVSLCFTFAFFSFHSYGLESRSVPCGDSFQRLVVHFSERPFELVVLCETRPLFEFH